MFNDRYYNSSSSAAAKSSYARHSSPSSEWKNVRYSNLISSTGNSSSTERLSSSFNRGKDGIFRPKSIYSVATEIDFDTSRLQRSMTPIQANPRLSHLYNRREPSVTRTQSDGGSRYSSSPIRIRNDYSTNYTSSYNSNHNDLSYSYGRSSNYVSPISSYSSPTPSYGKYTPSSYRQFTTKYYAPKIRDRPLLSNLNLRFGLSNGGTTSSSMPRKTSGGGGKGSTSSNHKASSISSTTSSPSGSSADHTPSSSTNTKPALERNKFLIKFREHDKPDALNRRQSSISWDIPFDHQQLVAPTANKVDVIEEQEAENEVSSPPPSDSLTRWKGSFNLNDCDGGVLKKENRDEQPVPQKQEPTLIKETVERASCHVEVPEVKDCQPRMTPSQSGDIVAVKKKPFKPSEKVEVAKNKPAVSTDKPKSKTKVVKQAKNLDEEAKQERAQPKTRSLKLPSAATVAATRKPVVVVATAPIMTVIDIPYCDQTTELRICDVNESSAAMAKPKLVTKVKPKPVEEQLKNDTSLLLPPLLIIPTDSKAEAKEPEPELQSPVATKQKAKFKKSATSQLFTAIESSAAAVEEATKLPESKTKSESKKPKCKPEPVLSPISPPVEKPPKKPKTPLKVEVPAGPTEETKKVTSPPASLLSPPKSPVSPRSQTSKSATKTPPMTPEIEMVKSKPETKPKLEVLTPPKTPKLLDEPLKTKFSFNQILPAEVKSEVDTKVVSPPPPPAPAPKTPEIKTETPKLEPKSPKLEMVPTKSLKPEPTTPPPRSPKLEVKSESDAKIMVPPLTPTTEIKKETFKLEPKLPKTEAVPSKAPKPEPRPSPAPRSPKLEPQESKTPEPAKSEQIIPAPKSPKPQVKSDVKLEPPRSASPQTKSLKPAAKTDLAVPTVAVKRTKSQKTAKANDLTGAGVAVVRPVANEEENAAAKIKMEAAKLEPKPSLASAIPAAIKVSTETMSSKQTESKSKTEQNETNQAVNNKKRLVKKDVVRVVDAFLDKVAVATVKTEQQQHVTEEQNGDRIGVVLEAKSKTPTPKKKKKVISKTKTSDSVNELKPDDDETTAAAVANNETETEDRLQPESQSNSKLALKIATDPFQKKRPHQKKIRFREYTIDDFVFLTVLGRGSFGKVLLAELHNHECYFAVKCLKKQTVIDDDDVESIMIERKVLAYGTSHPFICKLFCTFQTESHLFFAMELCSGGDLMFHVQKETKFSENKARFYASEILCAIWFLHKRSIIYRDLKLDNVMVANDGHIRLVDFGMCVGKMYREEFLPSNFCGTPEYMAPEIIKGVKYNHSVDYWALGVVIYEMCVGTSPFHGTDEDELLWNVCNTEVHYPKFLSEQVKNLIVLLLKKNPLERLGLPTSPHGDIVAQPWFHGVQWDLVEKCKVKPPFIPQLSHDADVSYFDQYFTKETPCITPCNTRLPETDQMLFQGFNYTNHRMTD